MNGASVAQVSDEDNCEFGSRDPRGRRLLLLQLIVDGVDVQKSLRWVLPDAIPSIKDGDCESGSCNDLTNAALTWMTLHASQESGRVVP